MYERMYDYTSKRRASCSVVRSCHVRVGHGAHAIVRNVLKVVEVVREDVRSLPSPFVYRKMFVNIRCRIHSLYRNGTFFLSTKTCSGVLRFL